jgi:two-component system chemotaxis response regulator CheY
MTVDDAGTMRRMISITLRGAGHSVVEACDGQDAFDRLRGIAVDMVITDINMPRMNGIDLVRALRATVQHRTTPIILLTTESEPAMKAKGREAGATGWIVKPFQQDQLLAVVKKVLG